MKNHWLKTRASRRNLTKYVIEYHNTFRFNIDSIVMNLNVLYPHLHVKSTDNSLFVYIMDMAMGKSSLPSEVVVYTQCSTKPITMHRLRNPSWVLRSTNNSFAINGILEFEVHSKDIASINDPLIGVI